MTARMEKNADAVGDEVRRVEGADDPLPSREVSQVSRASRVVASVLRVAMISTSRSVAD